MTKRFVIEFDSTVSEGTLQYLLTEMRAVSYDEITISPLEDDHTPHLNSVLQPWVMELPLREQGVLLTAVRNCDVAPKHPDNLETPERALTAWLRWCFLNPADPREVDYEPGSWFRSTPPTRFKQSMFGHLPQHWLGHAMHALEVVAYRYPAYEVRVEAFRLYRTLVEGMHLCPEPREDMIRRLSEDRIKTGTVVS